VARDIAKFLNEKSGGDKVTPGYISVSPETLDHYFTFATGGLGRFAKNVEATGEALAKGEAPPLRTVPFARRFAYEASPGQTGQKFYEAVQQVTNLKQRIKTYREEGQAKKLLAIPSTWRLAALEIDRIKSRVSQLRKSSNPRAAEEVTRLQSRANKVYADAVRAAGEL
jgi:hypothetical protein